MAGLLSRHVTAYVEPQTTTREPVEGSFGIVRIDVDQVALLHLHDSDADLSAGERLTSWVPRLKHPMRRTPSGTAAVSLAFSRECPLIDSTVVAVSSPERILQLAQLSQEVNPQQFWDRAAESGSAPSPILDPSVR